MKRLVNASSSEHSKTLTLTVALILTLALALALALTLTLTLTLTFASSSPFKVRDRSRAEENAADSEHPGIMDHQCVAVCNGSDDFNDCFPGSIAWMAHDLLELAGKDEVVRV